MLTERVRDHLFGPGASETVTVIPCCADLARFDRNLGDVERARDRLGLDGRLVMVYVGKLTEPYMDREMVDFFAVARRLNPGLAFLVVTQAPAASIRSELVRAGIRSRPGATSSPVDRADPARDARNELEQLRDEARYRRERLELYRARLYGGRALSQPKLTELQRAADGAATRLERAEAAPPAPRAP